MKIHRCRSVSTGLLLCLAAAVWTDSVSAEAQVPDLSGFYDSSSLTPLNRAREFGEKRFMTLAEAEAIMADAAARYAKDAQPSDPKRGAPAIGGAAPTFADDDQRETLGAGNVGGYNYFWVDPGTDLVEIDGRIPTSIIYDPPDGRAPAMTARGMRRAADNFSSFSKPNDGTAWWLAEKGPGPFDGPEHLALAERCLLGFSAGPPMLPGLYNNQKRIIQTDTHVMILVEMVHDARIIRLNAPHAPAANRSWLGDSVGHWEGDTLVVDTIHFRSQTGLSGGDENLHLVERFTRLPDGNLLYDFTVDDPSAWTRNWSGQYVWKASDAKVFEYACHEGNYAMGGILRGARLLEAESAQSGGS